mgnify:CR=1 FL=1
MAGGSAMASAVINALCLQAGKRMAGGNPVGSEARQPYELALSMAKMANRAERRGVGVFVQDESIGLKISVHVVASNSAPMHRQ